MDPQAPEGTITALLQQADAGDKSALDRVFGLTYRELRRLAEQALRATPAGAGIEATALVGAACERLLGSHRLSAENRRHFFFLLGRAMHDVLVEQARAETAAKRGGGRRPGPLLQVPDEAPTVTLSVLDLHLALQEFAEVDPDAAQLVKLRYFSGLSLRDAAEVMGCSLGIARGHWDYAKAWLGERLTGKNGSA